MANLKAEFKSLQGVTYCLSVYSPNLEEDKVVNLGPDSVHIRYDRGKTKYATHKSMLCDISVVTSEDLSILYDDVPFNNEVKVWRKDNNKIMFLGYLIPAQWSSDNRPGIKHITLNAVDAIGMLKYKGLTNSYRFISTPPAIWTQIFADLDFEEKTNSDTSDLQVSVDSLLPDSHTESEVTGNWPSFEDLLEAINRLTNTQTMIWDGVPINVGVDNYLNLYWQSSATENANDNVVDDNLSIEIVPSHSRIEYAPSGGEKVLINDLFKDLDPGKLSTTYTQPVKPEDSDITYRFAWATSTDQQYIKDFYLEDVDSAWANRPNVMFYSSYGADQAAGVYTPVIWGKLRMKTTAKHTVWKGQNVFITASIFIGTAGTIYPAIWNASIKESDTATYDEDGNAHCLGAHLALKVGNTTIYPSYVDNSRYDEDGEGFYNVSYHFFNLPQGLIEPTIVNDSTGRLFMTQFSLLGGIITSSTFDNDYTVFDQISTDFKNPLNIDMKFMGDAGITMDYKAYVESGTNTSKTSMMQATRQMFKAQYQHPRRLFTCALPLSGFHPYKKVRWSGYKCTIDSADIDLRNDKVTVQLLESK